MNIYERRRAHLDSRLAIYLADPSKRAVQTDEYSNVTCMYRTSDGRKCFIGQDISDDEYDPNFEGCAITHYSDIFASLPKDIQELGANFLQSCQALHDDINQDSWGATGLTGNGKLKYNEIVIAFCTEP